MSVSCGADGIFQTSPHNLVLSRFRCERADSGEDSERHARPMRLTPNSRARHFAPRPFFVFASAAFR